MEGKKMQPRILHPASFSFRFEGEIKSFRVGSLSLLQGLFPTQELNQGLPPLQVDCLPAELPGNLFYRQAKAK